MARFKRVSKPGAIAVDPALSNYPRFIDHSGYEKLRAIREAVTLKSYVGGLYAAFEAGLVWLAISTFLECQHRSRILAAYAFDDNSIEAAIMARLFFLAVAFTFLVVWRRWRLTAIAERWGLGHYTYARKRYHSWVYVFLGTVLVLALAIPTFQQAPEEPWPLDYISFSVLSYILFASIVRYVGFRRPMALLYEKEGGPAFHETLMHLEDQGAEPPKKLFWEGVLAFLGSLTVIGAPLFAEWHQRKVIEAYIENKTDLKR